MKAYCDCFLYFFFLQKSPYFYILKHLDFGLYLTQSYYMASENYKFSHKLWGP